MVYALLFVFSCVAVIAAPLVPGVYAGFASFVAVLDQGFDCLEAQGTCNSYFSSLPALLLCVALGAVGLAANQAYCNRARNRADFVARMLWLQVTYVFAVLWLLSEYAPKLVVPEYDFAAAAATGLAVGSVLVVTVAYIALPIFLALFGFFGRVAAQVWKISLERVKCHFPAQ